KPKAQPTASPTAPAPKPEPAPPPAETAEGPDDPHAATMQTAWNAFCAAYESLGDRGSAEDRQQQWFRILAELFPGKQPDELSPTEWAVMRDEGPTRIVPF
ncbi:MAG: hypothetical protein AB1716_17160, partial [Planctomycetota bacterium]